MLSVNHAKLQWMITPSCTYRLSCGSRIFRSGLSEITTALLRWLVEKKWLLNSCAARQIADQQMTDKKMAAQQIADQSCAGLPRISLPSTELWLNIGTGTSCCYSRVVLVWLIVGIGSNTCCVWSRWEVMLFCLVTDCGWQILLWRWDGWWIAWTYDIVLKQVFTLTPIARITEWRYSVVCSDAQKLATGALLNCTSSSNTKCKCSIYTSGPVSRVLWPKGK